MGTVYEVEHVQLGTRYALKLFSAEECRTGSLKDRFLVEGKALAILEHPNVVHVTDLDYDESSGSPYIVGAWFPTWNMGLLLREGGGV